MTITEQVVNLNAPVHERWKFLEQYRPQIDELLGCYLSDFEGSEHLLDGLSAYKHQVVSKQYLEEIAYIASISSFNEDRVLAANLYYDILKFYFGCTAFAVSNGDTTYHGRNLDWHTDNNVLSKYSMIFDFRRSGKTIYKTVGWPGFVGALSGTKPGKFSLTLNAVLSQDTPQVALPVSFLLRDILDTASSYADAKRILEQTPIASDCLILLSGTGEAERVVIERTPKRYATRESQEPFIVVTNDYKKLENVRADNLLAATSCSRHDRALELLRQQLPASTNDCLGILTDENVIMGITVQQMVFDNRTGEIRFIYG